MVQPNEIHWRTLKPEKVKWRKKEKIQSRPWKVRKVMGEAQRKTVVNAPKGDDRSKCEY